MCALSWNMSERTCLRTHAAYRRHEFEIAQPRFGNNRAEDCRESLHDMCLHRLITRLEQAAVEAFGAASHVGTEHVLEQSCCTQLPLLLQLFCEGQWQARTLATLQTENIGTLSGSRPVLLVDQ